MLRKIQKHLNAQADIKTVGLEATGDKKNTHRIKNFTALRAVNPHLSEEELLSAITVDWDSIPEYSKERFIASAYHAFMEFMERPDAQAVLDAEKERLMREGSTLLDPKT